VSPIFCVITVSPIFCVITVSPMFCVITVGPIFCCTNFYKFYRKLWNLHKQNTQEDEFLWHLHRYQSLTYQRALIFVLNFVSNPFTVLFVTRQSIAHPVNVVSCSSNWNNGIVDLFIINNGSCVLLAGSERDKYDCISPLLCKINEMESWAFTPQWQKKRCFISMEQVNV
jgi:hypothetical protein